VPTDQPKRHCPQAIFTSQAVGQQPQQLLNMPTIHVVAASITVPPLFGLGTGSENDDPRYGHRIWRAALSRSRPSALNASSGRAACHAADAVLPDVEMGTTVRKPAKHTGDDGVPGLVLGGTELFILVRPLGLASLLEHRDLSASRFASASPSIAGS
jgi:hypothetical protein